MMSALPSVSDAPMGLHETHAHSGAADACLYCDPNLGFRSSGVDPLAFRAHLATSSNCMREYELWKAALQNEWLGD